MSDSGSDFDDELYKQMYRQKPAAREPSPPEEEDEEEYEAPSRAARAPKPPAKRQKTGGSRPAPQRDPGFEFDDDNDAIFKDEEDRAKLMSMNEFEREQIIADRKEQLLRNRERQQLLARGAAQAEAAKAAPVSNRRPDAKTKAMDTIRKAQERKKASSAKKWDDDFLADEEEVSESDSADEAEPLGPPAGAGPSYRDAGDDDELPAARPGTRATAAYEMDADEYHEAAVVPADYDEVVSIQVRRHRLEKWVNEPFFSNCLRNCVVRLALGSRRDPVTEQMVPQYLMATVEAVVSYEEGQHKDLNGRMVTCPYPFGANNARTDKWLEVARGGSRKMVTLALVSNERVTEAEYQHWRKQCKRDHDRGIIAHEDVAEIKDRLVKAENYQYTDQDVAAMVEAKRKRGIVKGSVTVERARLQRQLDAAVEKGDEEKQLQLQQELDALKAKQTMPLPALNKPAIHAINKKNADINFKNMLNNVSSRPEGALTTADGETIDVFSRRKTQPVVMIKPQKVGVREDTADTHPTAPSPLPTPSKQRKAKSKVSTDGLPDIDIDLRLLDEGLTFSQRLTQELMGSHWEETLDADTIQPRAWNTTFTIFDYARRQGMF